jgi:hypothetical protein
MEPAAPTSARTWVTGLQAAVQGDVSFLKTCGEAELERIGGSVRQRLRTPRLNLRLPTPTVARCCGRPHRQPVQRHRQRHNPAHPDHGGLTRGTLASPTSPVCPVRSAPTNIDHELAPARAVTTDEHLRSVHVDPLTEQVGVAVASGVLPDYADEYPAATPSRAMSRGRRRRGVADKPVRERPTSACQTLPRSRVSSRGSCSGPTNISARLHRLVIRDHGP